MNIPSIYRKDLSFHKHSKPEAETVFPAGFTATGHRAFSLTELLVVVALIGVLATLVIPSMGSIGTAQSLTMNASNLATTFEQARTYAMANNTYVYVGLWEADANKAESLRPQIGGIGRLYVAVGSINDGSNGYPNGQWLKSSDSSVRLTLQSLGRIQKLEGVHLVSAENLKSQIRLTDEDGVNGILDLSTEKAATPISTGSDGLGLTKPPVTTFEQVIQFSPTGGVNVIKSLTTPALQPPYIEFGLVQARGNIAENDPKNCALLRIDGVTGAVQTFRP